jgi:hypothetical protein
VTGLVLVTSSSEGVSGICDSAREGRLVMVYFDFRLVVWLKLAGCVMGVVYDKDAERTAIFKRIIAEPIHRGFREMGRKEPV